VDLSCETNPISGSSRGTGILPVNRNYGQDAHAPMPPDGGTTNPGQARGNRAKQSESGSGSTPQPGPVAQNKANSGRDSGLRRDRMCETKPICTRREVGGASPTLHVGAIAPNKPNSARPAGRLGPWKGQPCETNPIWLRLHPAAGSNGAKRSQFESGQRSPAGRVCETKPNLSRMGRLGVGSPGRSQWCKTNPIRPVARHPGDKMHRTNPIGQERIVQNEPNFGRVRGCSAPLFQYSIIPAFQSGAFVRNKANSCPSGRSDGPGIRRRMPAAAARRDCGRNR